MVQFETAEIMVNKVDGFSDVEDGPYLKELRASIERDGLLHPIIVRRIPEVGFYLVAGNQRLAAVKANGSHVIRASIVVEGTEADAMWQQVAENIFRKKTPRHERAELLLRWKESYEVEHPEVCRGYAGAAAKHKLPKKVNPADSFAEVVKKATGQGERQTFRDLADAKKLRTLSPEATWVLDCFEATTEERLAVADLSEEHRTYVISKMAIGDPVEWLLMNLDRIVPVKAKRHFEHHIKRVEAQDDGVFLRHCPARPSEDPRDFDVDAILRRRLEKLIHDFKRESKDFLTDAKIDKGKGPFFRALKLILNSGSPQNWKACDKCAQEDVSLANKACPVCSGAKYLIGR